MKPGKMVKSLVVVIIVFFLKLQQLRCKWNCFSVWSNLIQSPRPYVRSASLNKKALFLRFLRSLPITYLITLSLEKEIIFLEKSPEKVLNFGSKNLYEPFITSLDLMITAMRERAIALCSVVYSFWHATCDWPGRETGSMLNGEFWRGGGGYFLSVSHAAS